MTYTERQRASRPDVALRRHARTAILEAVYGPNIRNAAIGGVPFGLRDSARRAPWNKRVEVLRRYWRDAAWPDQKLSMVLADADVTFEEIAA